jgi:hypothetical protein
MDMTVLKNSAAIMASRELVNILNSTPQGRTLKNMADSKTRWNLMTKMSFGQHVDPKASENLRKRVLISFAKNDWSWLPAVVKVKGVGNNIKKSASINSDDARGQSILLNSDLKGGELSNYFFQEVGNFFAKSLHKSVCILSNRGLRLAAYLKNRRAIAPDHKHTGNRAINHFSRTNVPEFCKKNPKVHLRPSVIGRHQDIVRDARTISGYSGTTRYRDKAVIVGAVYGKALEVVSDSEALEPLALAVADLVRHRIHTAGSGVDAPPQSLLDDVKDKTWTVIEVECRKNHYSGIKLLDRKDTDAIDHAIEEELGEWWQSWKATSARVKDDVGTANPCNGCKNMETGLVEDAARTVSRILDKQYSSAAHPITDPSRIDRLQPGQILQAFEKNSTAVSPSILLEVVSECYRRTGGCVTFDGLDAMLAAGRYDNDKLSLMDQSAFDDTAQAFARNDNYSQTTIDQKRERFVRALCWDLGYTQAEPATGPHLPEKRDNLSCAVGKWLQGRTSGQKSDAEPHPLSSPPKADDQAVPPGQKGPYPALPAKAPWLDDSDTSMAPRVSALRALVNAGLQMINDYLGTSTATDLEAYGKIKEPITASDAIAYMNDLHDQDRRVALMIKFSGKLQKAIEKASETPRTYMASGDLSQDSQNADFISRLAAAYHVVRPQPGDADTMASNQKALHHLLGAAGVGATALSDRFEVTGNDRRRKTCLAPVDNQPAVANSMTTAPDVVQNPGREGSLLGKELVRFVAMALQNALKAADFGSVIRMAMATAAASAPAVQAAAATGKIGGILARGANAVRKLMRSSFVEKVLDDACDVTELVRVARIGSGSSFGGGTGGEGGDSESNGSDASGSDTAHKGNTKASAMTVARGRMPSRTDIAVFNGTRVGRIQWMPAQLGGLGRVLLPTVWVEIGETRQRFFIMAGSSTGRARSGNDIFVRQTEPGKNEFIPVDPTTGLDLEAKKFMRYSSGAKER